MITFAERLKLARLAAGFDTGRAAADRFGWTYPTYSSHENGGRDPRIGAVQDYARAFDVDEQWLLWGKGRGPRSLGTAAAEPRAAFAQPPQTRQREFAEPHVRPYMPRKATGPIPAASAAEAAQQAGAALYVLAEDYREWLLMADDILILDQKAAPSAGDIIVADLLTAANQEANIVLRRWMPGGLVPPLGEHAPAEAEFGILGVIKGAIRGAP